jgi:hypothetical protein
MDCDMIVRCDIAEILEECDLFHDVFVVKHDYMPKGGTKFLGNKQHVYPKKNWSSVMLFNCFTSSCKRLTPEVVNESSGKFLHQFEWCDGLRVGELSNKWNHLVGEYAPSDEAAIVHYTLGTPCFRGYDKQEYAKEWFNELESLTHADQ